MENEYQLSLTAEEIESKLKAAGVQPDWDQKNSNEPDYIKNRPCYTTLVYDLSVDTPQDLGIVKLWDFTNNSINFLNVFRRLLSSKNIRRAPGELLEDGSSKQMYLIWIGMWMPSTYDDNKWLSGIYTCKSLAESQITSIGGTNYKIKLTSMAYYFVFDTETLDADHVTLFDDVGVYVQPDDDWDGYLPLQGVLKLSVPTQLNDWFIPNTIARTSDLLNSGVATLPVHTYQRVSDKASMYKVNLADLKDGILYSGRGLLESSDTDTTLISLIIVCEDGTEKNIVADDGDDLWSIFKHTKSWLLYCKTGNSYHVIDIADLSTAANVTYTWYHNHKYLDVHNEYEYTPTNDYHPATKKYVDDAVADVLKLVSPSGKIFQITVDDSGALSTTEIS